MKQLGCTTAPVPASCTHSLLSGRRRPSSVAALAIFGEAVVVVASLTSMAALWGVGGGCTYC